MKGLTAFHPVTAEFLRQLAISTPMRATIATLVLSCSGGCEVLHYYRWNLLARNELLRPRNGAGQQKMETSGQHCCPEAIETVGRKAPLGYTVHGLSPYSERPRAT